MKKINVIFMSFLMVSVFWGMNVNKASARTQSHMVNFILETAQYEHNQGRIDQAIIQYKKVLMINPENVEARVYLSSYGMDNTIQNPVVNQKLDLAKKVKKLKQHNVDLEFSNMELTEELVSLKKAKGLIPQQAGKHAEMQWVENKLNRIQSHFGDSINKGSDEIQGGYQYYELVQISLDHEDALMKLQNTNTHLKHYVEDQYAHQNKIIYVLEDYLHIREDQIEEKEYSLISKDFEILKSEVLVLAKLDELIDVYEVNEKFDKILAEKERKIKHNNSEIDYLLRELDDSRYNIIR